nr:MAG TPA: hypothetical protein [Caudoviricetes sp.]
MKPIDPSKPVPISITTLWDSNGLRFDRDERDPDKWWYDILYPIAESWASLKDLRPYYTAPPQDWTWTENIRPNTSYYAQTERVHSPFWTIAGVCRSTKDGETLVFEDGSKADRHNDIVREAFPVVPCDRLSLLATGGNE